MNRFNIKKAFSSLLLVGVAIASASSYASPKAKELDIVDTAIAAGKFNTLVKAVQVAGLVDFLKLPGAITVFAPTDDAFDKIPKDALANLLANPQALRAVLLKHIYKGGALKVAEIQGVVLPSIAKETFAYQLRPAYYYLPMASGIANFTAFDSEDRPVFSAEPVYFFKKGRNSSNTDDQITNLNVKYVLKDVVTSNGIIQAIDNLLL